MHTCRIWFQPTTDGAILVLLSTILMPRKWLFWNWKYVFRQNKILRFNKLYLCYQNYGTMCNAYHRYFKLATTHKNFTKSPSSSQVSPGIKYYSSFPSFILLPPQQKPAHPHPPLFHFDETYEHESGFSLLLAIF